MYTSLILNKSKTIFLRHYFVNLQNTFTFASVLGYTSKWSTVYFNFKALLHPYLTTAKLKYGLESTGTVGVSES